MMPLKQMYNVTYRLNNNGIQGYDLKHRYQDPLNDKKKLTKSVINLKKHITDRGSYLKDNQKIKKHIPGPGTYKFIDDFHHLKKNRAKSLNSFKKTYIDQIVDKAKKNKEPAPGQYNINTKSKQISKTKNYSHQKITYLDEVEYEASCTPGPGAYNPHLPKNKLSNIVKSKQYWIKKSLDKQKKLKSSIPTPDGGMYNPNPVQYKIFGISEQNQKQLKSKINSFGKDERFEQNRAKKSRVGEVPGPGHYKITNQWGKQKQIQNNLLDKISKLPSKKVYY